MRFLQDTGRPGKATAGSPTENVFKKPLSNILIASTSRLREPGTWTQGKDMYLPSTQKMPQCILATEYFLGHRASVFSAIMALTFQVHGHQKHARYPSVITSV